MTTDQLRDPPMRERIARLRDAIDAAPAPRAAGRTARGTTDEGLPDSMSGSLVLAIESSCDETGIAADRGRAADPCRTSSRRRSPCMRRRAGSSRRWPPVPTCAGSSRCSTTRGADAGVDWPDVSAIAVTYGPGLAGSLLVGINFAKALSWVHDVPLVGVNHLEGHVYAAWLHDTATDEREDPVFPLVALVVSGGHTFLAEMRDHLTYRLLGSTVDDAAGEAFDKVGRLLGLGYPGGPAIGRAAEAATARDRVFPRAWLGDSFDLSFSGLKTAARRIVDRGPRRGRAGRSTGRARSPSAVVAELAWGFQDSVVDVLATQDDPGGAGGRGSIDRARRWRGGQHGPPGQAGRRGGGARHPARRAAAIAVHRQRRDDRCGRRATVRGRRTMRGSTWTPARRCHSPARMSGRVAPRVDAGERPVHAPGGRSPRAPRPVAELPRRPGRPRGDPRRGRSRTRSPGAGDRAGARPADGRPPRRRGVGHRRRARSRPRGVPARAVR